MARCGVASRRESDKIIAAGNVSIDGRQAKPGDLVSRDSVVMVYGRKISLPEETTVMVYNKPVGVTCTERDPHADRIITDEIDSDTRLTYAGRLDRDSEGLIIMTDDGRLIDAMMRGSAMHEKEYFVRVDRSISDKQLKKLSSGIYIRELDITTRPCEVIRQDENSFTIVLTQGLNRQIRRMCAEIGLNVVGLKRTRVMNIHLDDLQVGASRFLTDQEKKELYSLCGLHI